jgi:hypothetical protein
MPQPRSEYLAYHLRPPGLQIAAALRGGGAARRALGERREVLVGPEPTLLPETLWKVLHRLGLRAVARPSPRVAATVHWVLPTKAPPSAVPGAVNGRCTDISKRRVEAASQAALGYGAGVDPQRFEGECVRKSDENGLHDGVVVTAPVARPEPGAVYQRLIDTRIASDVLEELRLPFVAGHIPLAYVKRRPVADRFGKGRSRTAMTTPEQVLDAGERTALAAICADMGLDFGEVDVLRDRGDGRVYVVDVNRTPWGPARTLGTRGALRAVTTVAEVFEAAFVAAR